ncbi:MAG TPA: hypothetical protein VLH41_05505 [Thermoanaerobaculia bacterium]|nr:hypothetical protein [Thermoanaerobaculia bacterium]
MTSIEQLSGDYCYFGPDYNLRAFRRSPTMIPFVDVEAFGEPTKVSVEASAERIVFTFTDRDGNAGEHVFLPSVFRAAWKENALVVRWSGMGPNVGEMIGLNVLGNALGIIVGGLLGSYDPDLYLGSRGRESRLFRLVDGRLVMTDTFRASGDLKPADESPGYWKRQDSVAVLLDPVAGDCAPGPAHPPQPWFDAGIDLRNPACAAQLEESIVSILVVHGEEPESARLAAEARVTALCNGDGSWVRFSIRCPSNTTYGFQTGKRSSGCVLQLVERATERKVWTWSFGVSSARLNRPLPDCACN